MMDRTPPPTPRRASEVARLSRLLHACEDGLSICSISGPGGVGKTYLVEQVLFSERPRKLGYIQLSADASNPQTRGDFFGLVEGQLAAPDFSPSGRPDRYYFRQTRKVAAAHRDLVEKATAELDAREGASDEVKKVVVKLLQMGQGLNERMPKSEGRVGDARKGLSLLLDKNNAPNVVDKAWDTAVALKSLSGSTMLPGAIGRVLGQNLRDRVRRELFDVTADALVSDLASALEVEKGRRPWGRSKEKKPAWGRIESPSRFLVVIDDYEVLAPVLGDFLVGSLLPRLANAPFPTLLIVGSRDDLEATHPGWGQHAKRWMREQIRLAPFDEETAFRLLAEAGIAEERWAAIHEATRGLPFLLTLVVEEANAPEADSALFAKKFFDRTTRWMTPKEREWFAAVCYLDNIDEDTLRVFFPKEEVPLIQEWFEREASIRDPATRSFRMRQLVREKALRYLETRSPSRHREMLRKAKGPDGYSVSDETG